MKDALTLKSHDKHSMSIMTFGSGERNLSEYDVVRLGVATHDGMDQEVELFTVPLICQPLTSQPIDLCKSKYPQKALTHLHGFRDVREIERERVCVCVCMCVFTRSQSHRLLYYGCALDLLAMTCVVFEASVVHTFLLSVPVQFTFYALQSKCSYTLQR